MPKPARKGFWRRARRIARCLRITLWCLVLLALGSLLYLNRVGLPDFLRSRLITELRARGLDLEFSRLRLHWYRGLVAENLNLGRAAQPLGPQLYIDLMELRLDPAALKHFEFKVRSLLIRQARLVWPLVVPHQPPRRLSLDDLTTELRFLPNDQWELDRFQARCLGARIQLAGTLTNASWLQHWPGPRATNAVATARLNRLIEFIDAMETIKFPARPEIHIMMQGDARDPTTFNARLMVKAQRIVAPRGTVDNFFLVARLNQPPATNGETHSELRLKMDGLRAPWLEARDAHFTAELVARPYVDGLVRADWQTRVELGQSRWGSIRGAFAHGHTQRSSTNDFFLETDLGLHVDQWQTEWASGRDNQLSAHVQNRRSDWLPAAASGELRIRRAGSRWGAADRLRIMAQLARAPTNASVPAEAGWADWAKLAPLSLGWTGQLDRFESPNLALRNVRSAGRWEAPALTVHELHADLYDGQLDAAAGLDVASREATAQGRFDFDLHRIEPLLTPGSRHWLNQFAWRTSPKVQAQARVLLPVWTDRHPDWRGEVLPTLTLAGQFSGGPGAFRGVPVSSATAHFTFTNLVWALPDLVVDRPAGRVELNYRGHLFTHDYHWLVNSRLDPAALAPLLTEREQRALALFQFREPPWIQGEAWGRWFALERLGFRARVVATNLVFRDETCSSLAATVRFTNHFFTLTDARLHHGEQIVVVPGAGFDLAAERVYLTNAAATIDPTIVARAIGPKTARALAPYHFDQPPRARVNGSLHVRDIEGANLQFDVAGGPFRYGKFHLPQVAGTVLWRGDRLMITNFDGAFYGGRLRGGAGFDFSAPREADFHFQAAVTEANLRMLVADLGSATNRLEGVVDAHLDITSANTADRGSWNGFGNFTLRNGYLWDLPLFSVFSPILNKVVPGLGNSRFREGSATFTVTNSVLRTDNLEIRSPALRLYYSGTVDFQNRVNAQVEASLFRDTWLVGQLFGLALTPLTKIFEYKVTGTLKEPKTEPLYLPKFLLMPLHPFRTLKDLLFNPPATNAPTPATISN